MATFFVLAFLLSVVDAYEKPIEHDTHSLYLLFIFGLHVPLVVFFVIGVYTLRWAIHKRNRPGAQAMPARNTQALATVLPISQAILQTVSGQIQPKHVPKQPKTLRTKNRYIQVPDYWKKHLSLYSMQINSIEFIQVNPDDFEAVRTLVYSLWKPEHVAVGRDATKSLSKKHIQIQSVLRVENRALFEAYCAYKSKIRRKLSHIDRFKDLSELVESKDAIETTELINETLRHSCLTDDIDKDVNEHYLFHGTTAANIEAICRKGLSTFYARRTAFGTGVYIAEDPTKSDQYTDMFDDREGTLLLVRVCLGEIFVLKQATSSARDLKSPPCSTCFRHECPVHAYRFDSVVTDNEALGMRFREFIVYRDYQTYPEYIIKYERVTESEISE